MNILLSELPKSPWWGNGMPHYLENWAMKEGTRPDAHRTAKEHAAIKTLLSRETTIQILPFPAELDSLHFYNHDAVFLRDLFISNQSGDVILSHFSETKRQHEVTSIRPVLEQLRQRVHILSDTAYAEGGEFYFHPRSGILFAGVGRNNTAGVAEVARHVRARHVCIVASRAYHLDTFFTVVIDPQDRLRAVITCPSLISNWTDVLHFLTEHSLDCLSVDEPDTIGQEASIGTMAVNCLPVPGILFGGSPFKTKAIIPQLQRYAVVHRVSPTTQFQLSGGSIHCLTNEIGPPMV